MMHRDRGRWEEMLAEKQRRAYQSGGSGKDGSLVTATLWPGLTVRRVVMPAFWTSMTA